MRRLGQVALGIGVCALAACRKPGPHEDALVRAISNRDVAAADRAIASGVDYRVGVGLNGTSGDFPVLIVSEMERDPRAALPLERIGVAVLQAGASPDAATGSGRRRLSLVERAAATGSTALVDAMLKAGLDAKGEDASRALVVACRLGHTALAERLVAAGVDVNYHWWSHRDNPGAETPLSEAVQGRHADVIDLLERAGAREW
jgi:hypothetical protein